MGELSCFLAQNALKAENEMYVVSKRFLGTDRKPMVPVVGKKGQFTQETDYNLYLGKLAARCTLFPNLNDKELQDSYHVMGADALLKVMLTAGEYANYLEKVQEVNGFDVPMDELVDEAKN